MASKRPDHRGSIRQRPDGRWEGRISIGGKQHSRYGRTEDEVRDKLLELQVGVPLTASSLGAMSLDTWVTRWLGERDLRPSAKATYREVLAPILDDLGHVQLARLNPPMLALQFSLLRSRGRGARRLQLAHGYLRSCLDAAHEIGLVPANPMAKVRRPKWEPVARRYWSPDETARFLATAQASPLRYARLFLLLATTGLRISEVLGLEATDIDLGGGTLTVSRARVWHSGMGYQDNPTKTRAGRRTISVPAVGLPALDEIPFRTQAGTVPVPNTLKAVLVKLCAQADVPRITPHGLRHVHAALAYRATGDVYAVQKRLGHANVTTTMGIYGFGMGREEEVRAALDLVFQPAPPRDHGDPDAQRPARQGREDLGEGRGDHDQHQAQDYLDDPDQDE